MPVTLPNSFKQEEPDSNVLTVREAQRLNAEEDEARREVLFDYSVYENVLSYMTAEMNTNANEETVRLIASLNQEATQLAEEAADKPWLADKLLEQAAAAQSSAYGLFYDFVKAEGPWDYKDRDEFKRLFIKASIIGDGTVYVSPIRNDSHYLYFYDIWGNIHYGYIGIIAGFSEEVLKVANIGKAVIDAGSAVLEKISAGNFSSIPGFLGRSFFGEKDDLVSIKMGMELAQYGTSINKEQLHAVVFNDKNSWSEESVRLLPQNLKIAALQEKKASGS